MYYEKSLELKDLIGEKVFAVAVSEEHDYFALHTDRGLYHLTFVGDCCANCFVAHLNGAEYLLDATILEASQSEWVRHENNEDGWSGVSETMGITIKTDKGYVDFECRVEHNGYYGGYVLISMRGPLDQYNSPREDVVSMVAAKDF